MFKKAWDWMKRTYNAVTTVREEAPVYEANGNTVGETKPLSYWMEFAEQVRMEERIKEYQVQQAKLQAQLEEESLRKWRENNVMVDEYFRRGKVQKASHLRLVQ